MVNVKKIKMTKNMDDLKNHSKKESVILTKNDTAT